jgi:hypothetical protein
VVTLKTCGAVIRLNKKKTLRLVQLVGITYQNIMMHGPINIKELNAQIFVNNQLDTQFFFMYVHFYSLHVSGTHVPIIRRTSCINTRSGICHCIYGRLVWRFG